MCTISSAWYSKAKLSNHQKPLKYVLLCAFVPLTCFICKVSEFFPIKRGKNHQDRWAWQDCLAQHVNIEYKKSKAFGVFLAHWPVKQAWGSPVVFSFGGWENRLGKRKASDSQMQEESVQGCKAFHAETGKHFSMKGGWNFPRTCLELAHAAILLKEQ